MTMTLMSSHRAAFSLRQLHLHHSDKRRLNKKISDLCFLSNNGPLHGPVLPLPTPRARTSSEQLPLLPLVPSLRWFLPPILHQNPSTRPSCFSQVQYSFAFLITNFVVPKYITEPLQLDVAEELKNPNNNAELEDSPQPRRTRLQTRRQRRR